MVRAACNENDIGEIFVWLSSLLSMASIDIQKPKQSRGYYTIVSLAGLFVLAATLFLFLIDVSYVFV